MEEILIGKMYTQEVCTLFSNQATKLCALQQYGQVSLALHLQISQKVRLFVFHSFENKSDGIPHTVSVHYDDLTDMFCHKDPVGIPTKNVKM